MSYKIIMILLELFMVISLSLVPQQNTMRRLQSNSDSSDLSSSSYIQPTVKPTDNPIPAPTRNPTLVPTNNPTITTDTPTIETDIPTHIPTINPTNIPTNIPTINPTMNPVSGDDSDVVGCVCDGEIDFDFDYLLALVSSVLPNDETTGITIKTETDIGTPNVIGIETHVICESYCAMNITFMEQDGTIQTGSVDNSNNMIFPLNTIGDNVYIEMQKLTLDDVVVEMVCNCEGTVFDPFVGL
eukprot:223422_1